MINRDSRRRAPLIKNEVQQKPDNIRGIVIAGTHSGSGKTTVTLGLMAALRKKGLPVQPFKCGPDYIDPSYHRMACGVASRNLDTWRLAHPAVLEPFERANRGRDVPLAQAGMALSVMAGMGKKAAISHFDPETFDHKVKSIDCVFSKEFFYTIPDKPAFLRTVEGVMKSRGQLLFTDYVLAPSAERSAAFEKWLELEPIKPHIWSVQDYKEALTTLHLDIRVAEDITKQFHATVTQSWARYIKELQSRGVTPETTEVLVQEVELWARRVQAIEAGNLQVYRIHALKMDTDRLMSSW